MEKISALMDGELDEFEARGQLARLKLDPELARHWQTFHLIGDALRGERPLSAGFSERLSARMNQEPTVLAPRRLTRRAATYALSAAASISAVALVGWLTFVNHPLAPQAPQLAQSPAAVTSPAPPSAVPAPQLASVPSEGKMNEYLIAHQEFSPSTAIQGLAPYIRSVSTTQSVGR